MCQEGMGLGLKNATSKDNFTLSAASKHPGLCPGLRVGGALSVGCSGVPTVATSRPDAS